RTRQDLFPVETGIDTSHIVPTSRLVSSITGFPVQPNKAIVGANAFAHESGIHQDGVLKHRETYEIMRAQDVGWGHNRLVLGKHSGRAAVKARYEELGIHFEDTAEFQMVFERFKALADKKHEIFDEDLQSLVTGTEAPVERYRLEDLEVRSKIGSLPQAQLRLLIDGESHRVEAYGSGPVDATFKAIESIAKSQADLKLYSVNAVTQGTDSQGTVTVRLERDGRLVNGVGADTDILVASAQAYLDALNMLDSGENKRKGV
ncbi:alpha-isopropylmalate synthase regulatory domain-containing protein, partial [Microbulbifer thermotolerans]